MWRKQLKRPQQEQRQQLSQHPSYAQNAEKLFDLMITDDMLDVINTDDVDDPVLRQFLPHQDELQTHPNFTSDPVGDHEALKATGVIHKYHGRVLLIASGHCAVNCRYCFRRHFNYSQELAARNNWHAAIHYISQNENIHEVILSGGDPLTLSTKQLMSLSAQLEKITHIKTLRIHSRIPVALPDRIDADFCSWIKQLNLQTVMVIHSNHPNEITDKALDALKQLNSLGVTLLNQSVLLKGVNDDADVLIKLNQQLFQAGVLPYYLNVLDKVQNAGHFLVNDQTARQIHRQLKEKLPGYLVPKLTQENPGEPHKTTLLS
ncbi:EF-P beta-lysylation protein EpmB [Marinicella sp. W31]|uniref:EF-P beta-lysylation protein EpmB n=1 Tax=Marinicella sp. W31 TaxID=3023713 RepID=UPI0037578C9E